MEDLREIEEGRSLGFERNKDSELGRQGATLVFPENKSLLRFPLTQSYLTFLVYAGHFRFILLSKLTTNTVMF